MVGGGSPGESPTKFFNKSSVLKLNDLVNVEVAEIVYAHFTDSLSSKLSKFFTLTNISSRATRATESPHNNLYYTFTDFQPFDFNDALNIKELKFRIISHLKFKIRQQDCLKANTKNMFY